MKCKNADREHFTHAFNKWLTTVTTVTRRANLLCMRIISKYSRKSLSFSILQSTGRPFLPSSHHLGEDLKVPAGHLTLPPWWKLLSANATEVLWKSQIRGDGVRNPAHVQRKPVRLPPAWLLCDLLPPPWNGCSFTCFYVFHGVSQLLEPPTPVVLHCLQLSTLPCMPRRSRGSKEGALSAPGN